MMKCKIKFIDSMSIHSSSKLGTLIGDRIFRHMLCILKHHKREEKNNNKASTLKRNDNNC